MEIKVANCFINQNIPGLVFFIVNITAAFLCVYAVLSWLFCVGFEFEATFLTRLDSINIAHIEAQKCLRMTPRYLRTLELLQLLP